MNLSARLTARETRRDDAATLDAAKAAWFARAQTDTDVVDGALAGISFSLAFDDPTLADAIFLMFGGARPRTGRVHPASLTATIRTADAPGGWGVLFCGGSIIQPLDGREFTFALSLADGPFRESHEERWTLIAFRDAEEPLIAFDDSVMLFRTDGDWQKAIIIYLFCRLLRSRRDAIFLHAGSIAIDGRGFLFIGPKGSGKSTTTTSLAARGHRFLGDECGAYLPASRSIIPFRRPVGIKPGPRASAIAASLPHAKHVVAGEGFIRVALEELIDVDRSDEAAPLSGVVFLRGFRSEPALTAIAPGREDVGAVQPIAGSLINAPGTTRVFQLVDMLANTRVYSLHPGDPDATATYLEEVLSSCP